MTHAELVKGIYKKAAGNIIDKLKVSLGIEEPSAVPDAKTLAAMGGAGALGTGIGAVSGAWLGDSVAQKATQKALTNKIMERLRARGELGGVRGAGKLADKLFTRTWTTKAPASADDIIGWHDSSYAPTTFLTKSKADRILRDATNKNINRMLRRGGKIGAGIGAVTATGAAYALANPRTRAAIARLVG